MERYHKRLKQDSPTPIVKNALPSSMVKNLPSLPTPMVKHVPPPPIPMVKNVERIDSTSVDINLVKLQYDPGLRDPIIEYDANIRDQF